MALRSRMAVGGIQEPAPKTGDYISFNMAVVRVDSFESNNHSVQSFYHLSSEFTTKMTIVIDLSIYL